MRVCNITCVNPFIFITQVCQNYKLWLCLIITFFSVDLSETVYKVKKN